MNLHRYLLAAWLAALLMTGTVWASGPGIIQDHNGTTGTLYDFGGVKLYQDSRGTTGTVYDFGAIQQYQFTSPTGEQQSGTIYRFGGPQMSPVIPLPQTPNTPLYPVIPYGGGMAPHSNPGGNSGRGGFGR
jgi:hypothetical protein